MDGLRGPFLLCSPAEAEAIKLFSNAYLAMRVAFFNELDTCADMKGLDSERIIRGLGLDARIGDYYNNPSFGYGGYCLPKDTKQLESSCGDIPQELVSAIVKSNETRKRYLVDKIKGMEPTRVGVYRLAMKRDSDNCRNSSIGDVAACLGDSGISILVFEPLLLEDNFKGFEVTRDLGRLFDECDLIIANRVTRDLRQYSGTIVTRDVFNRD